MAGFLPMNQEVEGMWVPAPGADDEMDWGESQFEEQHESSTKASARDEPVCIVAVSVKAFENRTGAPYNRENITNSAEYSHADGTEADNTRDPLFGLPWHDIQDKIAISDFWRRHFSKKAAEGKMSPLEITEGFDYVTDGYDRTSCYDRYLEKLCETDTPVSEIYDGSEKDEFDHRMAVYRSFHGHFKRQVEAGKISEDSAIQRFEYVCMGQHYSECYERYLESEMSGVTAALKASSLE